MLLKANAQESSLCALVAICSFSYRPALQKQRDFVCWFICSLLFSSLFFLGIRARVKTSAPWSQSSPRSDEDKRIKLRFVNPKHIPGQPGPDCLSLFSISGNINGLGQWQTFGHSSQGTGSLLVPQVLAVLPISLSSWKTHRDPNLNVSSA